MFYLNLTSLASPISVIVQRLLYTLGQFRDQFISRINNLQLNEKNNAHLIFIAMSSAYVRRQSSHGCLVFLGSKMTIETKCHDAQANQG
jgi:hypothetical protein